MPGAPAGAQTGQLAATATIRPGAAPAQAQAPAAKAGATVQSAGKAAAPTAAPGSGPAAAVLAANAQAAPALAPRRQPTLAEINAAIGAVHKLVSFFTPTPAQVAKVGDQVCTAFDQGKSFAEVKSKVSDMLGHWSWLIPSSVPRDGVRTVVALYCPAYASKVV